MMCNSMRKRYITLNSKGSAIVTVVVSMMFIMALGAALLFTAYTAYSVQITQRGDKANFYDASSAMDDMRLGVQTILSQSIAEAYTDVIASYINQPEGYNPQADFNQKIIDRLATKTVTVGGASSAIFTYSTVSGKTMITGCNSGALAAFIEVVPSDATVTVTVGGAETGSSEVSIKALGVKYVSADGYESDIKSDIVIAMPSFFASSKAVSSINHYTIIANNSISQSSGGPLSISGSVFAGNGGVSVTGSGNSLTLTGGNLVCRGRLLIDNSAAFSFNSASNELWAREVKIGTSGSSSLLLNGNVYVADDLSINGSGAAVALRNSYFGFGRSTVSSAGSSSIIINGTGNSLDISGLNRLSLAGVSFIDTNNSLTDLATSGSFTSMIMMGESMSVKSDQLAYLVPEACISYASNPCVLATADTSAPAIDMNTVLWSIDGSDKKLSDYISAGNIKTLYKSLDATNNIVYVFMAFTDKASANKYFQDYFKADPSKISEYLSLYVTLSGKASSTDTAGNTFYTTDGGTLALNPASDTVWAGGAEALFNSMSSPYGELINTDKVSSLGGVRLEFTSGGNTVAVVADGDYSYTDSNDKVRLIIASGNVTISSSYTGIIIAGGSVVLNGGATAALLDPAILSAVCIEGGTEYTLSDFIKNSSQFTGASASSRDLWNLDSLVSYANWSKQ